jgi:hypothetical protein
VPGLYWITLFGPRYVSWFGTERFTALDATVETLSDGGRLVQFGESPDDACREETLRRKRAAIEVLGDDAFFDLTRPDRVLRTPYVIRRTTNRTR